jgi:aspartyl-tRNA(Asn)/glutamyl-tRNA(Gln) amidotransferase subunit A
VAVKDNIDVAGLGCTAGSDFFRDRIADSDATAVRRLRSAGVVVVGKTNMHEFAYGATNDNPFYGRCRNPWRLEAISGGSSGGSAVAVAVDSCAVALASDTGGSGRIPAAFCGVTGFRPTFGAVPCTGMFPTSPTLDTVAVVAREIDDVAAAFHAMAGYDPEDARSEQVTPAAAAPGREPAETLRIGIVATASATDVDPEVADAVTDAAGVLADAGYRVEHVADHGLEPAFDACDTIMKCEALAVHSERLEQEPERFGEDIRRRLELGRRITGAQLAGAYEQQARWVRTVETLLAGPEGYDAFLLPTAPVAAPAAEGSETIATTARVARLTYPWSLALTPALSLPGGQTRDGLPIGIQVVAARFAEEKLFAIARDFQALTAWHRMRPPPQPAAPAASNTAGWSGAR